MQNTRFNSKDATALADTSSSAFETPNHAEYGDSLSLSTESNMSEEALSPDQYGQESDEPISSVSEEVQMPQENSETDEHVTADTQSSRHYC